VNIPHDLMAEAIERALAFGRSSYKERPAVADTHLCEEQRWTLARALGFADWAEVPHEVRSVLEQRFRDGWTEQRLCGGAT
jgi:hypothetical protein